MNVDTEKGPVRNLFLKLFLTVLDYIKAEATD
jgi:hypothetical protein